MHGGHRVESEALPLVAQRRTLIAAMRLRRRGTVPELNAGFDWREIVCDSEDAAKAEAQRQQALDNDDEAEWIYLKPEETGIWVARRTPRHMELHRSWIPVPSPDVVG
jgi:hypothetical protein